jgi:hypothetical protein
VPPDRRRARQGLTAHRVTVIGQAEAFRTPYGAVRRAEPLPGPRGGDTIAVEERRRIALHRAAAASWGEEVADTLVDLVAPSGHELATRADIQGILAALEAMDARWDERFASAEQRWDERFTSAEQRWDERFASAQQRWDERFVRTVRRWDERFAEVDRRWAERFEENNLRWAGRFDAVERSQSESAVRLDEVEHRLGERFDALDGHLRHTDASIGAVARRTEEIAAEMEGQEDRLSASFQGDLRDAITSQTRTMVISLFGALVALAGLILGVG